MLICLRMDPVPWTQAVGLRTHGSLAPPLRWSVGRLTAPAWRQWKWNGMITKTEQLTAVNSMGLEPIPAQTVSDLLSILSVEGRRGRVFAGKVWKYVCLTSSPEHDYVIALNALISVQAVVKMDCRAYSHVRIAFCWWICWNCWRGKFQCCFRRPESVCMARWPWWYSCTSVKCYRITLRL